MKLNTFLGYFVSFSLLTASPMGLMAMEPAPTNDATAVSTQNESIPAELSPAELSPLGQIGSGFYSLFTGFGLFVSDQFEYEKQVGKNCFNIAGSKMKETGTDIYNEAGPVRVSLVSAVVVYALYRLAVWKWNTRK